jgi:hypothetical protein
VATTTNDFTVALNERERELFSTIERSGLIEAEDTTINSEVKGFRKPGENEVTHPFPLVKNGYKLPVN